MGITFRHDVAAGMVGAYASGQAARQRRGQKYGMDMLARQQAQRQRLGAAGARRGAASQVEGKWDDPLALAPPSAANGPVPLGERQASVTNRAAQKARARKGRLGKGIPAAWQPKYASPAELKRNQELDDAALGRQQDVDDAALKRKQVVDDATLAFHQGAGMPQVLQKIPDHLIDSPFAPDLKKLQGAWRAAGNPTWSPEQRKEARDKILKELEEMELPSAKNAQDTYDDNTIHYGPDNKRLAERGEGPGVRSGRMVNGVFEEDEWSKDAREGATAAATKTTEDEAAKKEGIISARQALYEAQGKLEAAKGKESSLGEQAALQAIVDLRKEQLNELQPPAPGFWDSAFNALREGADDALGEKAEGVDPEDVIPPPPAQPDAPAVDGEPAEPPVFDTPPPPAELGQPGQPAPTQPAESTLPPDPGTEPTGKGAEIANAMGLVWRKLPGGRKNRRHGWTNPEGTQRQPRKDHGARAREAAFSGPEPSVAAQPPKMPKDEKDLTVGTVYNVPSGKRKGLWRFNGGTQFVRVE